MTFFFFSFFQVRYQFSVEASPDGAAPQFRLVCPHDAASPLVGPSPDDVCLRAATLLAEAAGKKGPGKVRGEEWFGLAHPTVRALLQVRRSAVVLRSFV